MNPPKPKSIALCIGMAGIALLILSALSGCDKITGKNEHKTMREREIEAAKSAPHQTVELMPVASHAQAIDQAYWRGVIDQAISNDAGKPIVIAERRNGRLIVYKPIETYAIPRVEMEAEALALIEAAEKPILAPKKGR